MAYARANETGTYIYDDGEYINFNLNKISNIDINILLATLNDHHKIELERRIIEGRRLIKNFQQEGDYFEHNERSI